MSERLIAKRFEDLCHLRRGLDMIHNRLMDPSAPRQAVGEICAHWLGQADYLLEEPMRADDPQPPAKGCICPPGPEKTCQRWDCGRKTPGVEVRS